MEEVWKDIPDYEGLYQVSNLGNVKSLNFNRTGKAKLLKLTVNVYGYLVVGLYKDKKAKVEKVHQLVAESFLNHIRCGFKLVINHINFTKTDNRVENLEIVTTRENSNQKHIPSTSKYTGVSWSKSANSWQSTISINCKVMRLGTFDDELEASQYYENALIALQNGTEIQIKRAATSSKYIGVSWYKKSNKWRARINKNKVLHLLGLFDTEDEAYQAILDYKKLINL